MSGPNGIGMNNPVRALTVHNGDLMAGGQFTQAGGETVNRIAHWDGSQWSALSSPNGIGMNHAVYALAVHNSDLIAGGQFTEAGGVTVNYIARWDGSDWSALSGPNGTGMNGTVFALTGHNGDLMAGGSFTQAGGLAAWRIARWDGSKWSALSGPNGAGMDSQVLALTVHNGDLMAGGAFAQAGGETVNYIARWDGSKWSALSGPNDTGMGGAGYPNVVALTVHNGDLMAGGNFTQAGALPAWHLAHWQPETTVTELMSVEHDTVDPGEPVLVVAAVRGPASIPDGGLRGRIEADSGESCEATVMPESGTTATFSCAIILEEPGPRSLTAYYTGSARYHPSQSGTKMVNHIVFKNRFESPDH